MENQDPAANRCRRTLQDPIFEAGSRAHWFCAFECEFKDLLRSAILDAGPRIHWFCGLECGCCTVCSKLQTVCPDRSPFGRAVSPITSMPPRFRQNVGPVAGIGEGSLPSILVSFGRFVVFPAHGLAIHIMGNDPCPISAIAGVTHARFSPKPDPRGRNRGRVTSQYLGMVWKGFRFPSSWISYRSHGE